MPDPAPVPAPDKLSVLEERVTALEVQVVLLTKALMSLGSHALGGSPGPQFFLAWAEEQRNLAPPTEAATGRPVTVNPTSGETQPGSSPQGSQPGSAGSTGSASPSGNK